MEPIHTLQQWYQQQQQFFESGATRSYAFRKQQLLVLKKAILAYETRILEALHKDLRKPAVEAYGTEVGFSLSEISYTLAHLKEWMTPVTVGTPMIAQPAGSFIQRDPLGITLIIAPWNYPFQLLMAPLIGAIAGGNCVFLKPSEETPHTAHVVEEMIRAYFVPEYITMVQGEGGVVVPQLMEAVRFDHVFFTGSVSVGKLIMAAAARHLTPVTLELGGKSPCIVHRDARMSKAARRIVWGKFLNAGQTCVAPDYLLVHEDVKDELVGLMKQEIVAFYGADASESALYPRMVNAKRFDAVVRLLSVGKALIGGNYRADDLYIAPTIIEGVGLDNPIMQEEIFGPVLPVMTYRKLEDIPAIVARNAYPLALYFFSESRKAQQYILEQIRFGGGCINDTMLHLSNPELPFGGVGSSGLGAYHGRYSFETFTHAKSVLRASTLIDLPLRYPPYGKFAERMIKTILR